MALLTRASGHIERVIATHDFVKRRVLQARQQLANLRRRAECVSRFLNEQHGFRNRRQMSRRAAAVCWADAADNRRRPGRASAPLSPRAATCEAMRPSSHGFAADEQRIADRTRFVPRRSCRASGVPGRDGGSRGCAAMSGDVGELKGGSGYAAGGEPTRGVHHERGGLAGAGSMRQRDGGARGCAGIHLQPVHGAYSTGGYDGCASGNSAETTETICVSVELTPTRRLRRITGLS